jgi:hypothetical protein
MFPRGTRELALLIRRYCGYRWGFCSLRLSSIASLLKRSIRWVTARLRCLVQAGLIIIQRRGPHPSIYRLSPQFADLFADLFGSHPYMSSEELFPFELYHSTRSDVRNAHGAHGEHRANETLTLDSQAGTEKIGRMATMPDSDFARYIELFDYKPLNERDRMLAAREWVSLEEHDRQAALIEAREICSREAKYIPLPVNHLKSRSWSRVAAKKREKGEKGGCSDWLKRAAAGTLEPGEIGYDKQEACRRNIAC